MPIYWIEEWDGTYDLVQIKPVGDDMNLLMRYVSDGLIHQVSIAYFESLCRGEATKQ